MQRRGPKAAERIQENGTGFMRAMICQELGQPLTPAEVADPPAPGPDQVEIAVRAAGVNFPDLLMVRGLYQDKPDLPFAPGLEVAGTIAACGAEVAGLSPGDRVLATVRHGGFAEKVVADAARTHRIPDAMPFDQAAGFAIVYLSSWVALVERCRLREGETLLVLGASGGVGLAAVEIGKALGARVIAAAGSPEKLAVCAEAGADEGVDYAAEDLRDRVRALTDGRGADVIFDPVGGDMFDKALRAIAWEGRIAVVGFASGQIPQIPANYLLVKNAAAVGVNGGSYMVRGGPAIGRALERMFDWWAAGRLRPRISGRLPLAEADEALARIAERKVTGKLVLTVADD